MVASLALASEFAFEVASFVLASEVASLALASEFAFEVASFVLASSALASFVLASEDSSAPLLVFSFVVHLDASLLSAASCTAAYGYPSKKMNLAQMEQSNCSNRKSRPFASSKTL